jgi:arylsulfatase A-like enzyme
VSQDSVRADHLSALGYGRSTSPELEALAGDWVVFERAMAPAPWTLPSMLSQFTARYPSFHGGRQVRRARDLDSGHLSVFDVLAREGFTVLGVTGNELISHRFHAASGFDALWFDDKQQADSTNQLALRAVDEWGGGDLALFVHYMDPHAPYSPPPPYDSLFADPDHPRKAHRWTLDDLRRLDHTDADVRQLEALYDGELARTDAAIADLLRRLAARGLLAESVLVYSADHGEEFQDHGGWGHGGHLHEEVLHVPLALRVPGVEPRRIDTLVSLVDLAPTLLDALRIESPSSFEGRSLLPLMRGEAWPESALFSETDRTPDGTHHVSVRRSNRKYIAATEAGSARPANLVAEALYDLDTDPEERRPLESGPELAPFRREVLEYLARARQEVRLGPAIELTRKEEERLRARGDLR